MARRQAARFLAEYCIMTCSFVSTRDRDANVIQTRDSKETKGV